MDLLNGQRTGGEHLPAVEASTTDSIFNAHGIANFLSNDRLAGSVPASMARSQGKTKKGKRVSNKKVDKVAAAASQALMAHSWVAIDNFVPRESVEAIRKEMLVMEDSYTPGEIWVGASNEVRSIP